MSKWIERLLLVAQIGGGFAGFIGIFYSLGSTKPSNTTIVIHVLLSLIFLLGIIAGLTLIENRNWGLRLSRIYQLIQIPILTCPHLYIFSRMPGSDFLQING